MARRAGRLVRRDLRLSPLGALRVLRSRPMSGRRIALLPLVPLLVLTMGSLEAARAAVPKSTSDVGPGTETVPNEAA